MARTLFLPGFSHHFQGRARGTARKMESRAERLDGLARLVARFVPESLVAPADRQRKRVYTPWVTFIAFLGQILTRGSSCREAVRRVQSWRLAGGLEVPDDNTSAYCQARRRLSLAALRTAHETVGAWMQRHKLAAWQWRGRDVKVLDGCGVTMPDTGANRTKWPYAGGQKPGCGFPTAQLIGLFCLGTGQLLRFAFDSWKTHEIPLARQLVGWINQGDILLADRGFCGWALIALLRRKGVDVVMRAHQARRLQGRTMSWPKPQRGEAWEKSLWRELPGEVSMRIVRFQVKQAGYRTRDITLVTTLLDEEAYPDEAIAQLYLRRWAIELFFRDIKTTLGLDVLRCETPEMVEREVQMQAIAYNLIRALMLEAAWTHDVDLERLSFKGTVDTLRQWAPLFAPSLFAFRRARAELLRIIAADTVPLRPGRSEPRVKKRRPKNYQLLTKPRRQMQVSPSRYGK